MNKEQLSEILKLHKMWLNDEEGGKFANLRDADLSDANLRSADLSDANLRDANLPIYCKWSHSIIDDKIKIGCKIMSIDEWDSFFTSDEVFETQRNTEDFKRIQAVYNAYKAYLNTLKS